MRFRDLEIGQKFRFQGTDAVSTRDGPGTYVGSDGQRGYLDKRRRSYNVLPESEPPSAIAAAERDAREPYHLLQNIVVTAEEARERRAKDECGLQEAVQRIRREKMTAGLNVLQEHLRDNASLDRDAVLHDLIELVKGLVR